MASTESQQLRTQTTESAMFGPESSLPGLISLSTRNMIVDVISCGVEPFAWLLGVLGNLLSLVVLSYQGFKQTTNIILVGLALSDLLCVLFSSYRLVACVARHRDPVLAAEIDIMDVLYLGKVTNIFAIVSKWYICFIAVERFIVVQYPLKATALLKWKRIVVASVVVWIVAFSSFIYTFMLFDAAEVYNPSLNRSVRIIQLSTFHRNNADFLLSFSTFVHPMFTAYMPMLGVFVCTCVILRSLRLSAQQRSQLTSSASGMDIQQRQITLTLVSFCIVFLFTNIPEIAISLGRLLFLKDGFVASGRYKNIQAVSIAIMLLCNLINSSVNIVFYVLFNKKFRSTCRQLFELCLKKVSLTRVDNKSRLMKAPKCERVDGVARENLGFVE